jgi:hypothetical protein
MTPILLTTYVLAWPVIVAAVLFYLVQAFYCDWSEARAENRSMI